MSIVLDLSSTLKFIDTKLACFKMTLIRVLLVLEHLPATEGSGLWKLLHLALPALFSISVDSIPKIALWAYYLFSTDLSSLAGFWKSLLCAAPINKFTFYRVTKHYLKSIKTQPTISDHGITVISALHPLGH